MPEDPPVMSPEAVQAHLVRVRGALGRLEPEEKRMFGGTAFMVRGNMLCCFSKKGLMVRVGAAAEPEALARPHARRCEGTGRAMPGFVMVAEPGLAADDDLGAWLAMAHAYVGALPPKAAKP